MVGTALSEVCFVSVLDVLKTHLPRFLITEPQESGIVHCPVSRQRIRCSGHIDVNDWSVTPVTILINEARIYTIGCAGESSPSTYRIWRVLLQLL